jgi:hypothetical protein
MTDGQSASLSWCRTPIGTHDQILSQGSDRYILLSCGVLSDERVGLSFVICHLSLSLSGLYICNFSLYVHIQGLHFTTYNTYMASVSPGFVQQIIPPLCYSSSLVT